MSTAVAMVPSPAPHERTSFASDRPAPTAATASSTSPPARNAVPSQPRSQQHTGATAASQSPNRGSPKSDHAAANKSSPNASRNDAAAHPKIVVKKEPVSPSLPASRPRPRRLDLSKNTLAGSNPSSAYPLTARDGLGIQEVGIACLSPGFMTQDPAMKEQLQRSMSVREQQRSLIEARLQQQQSAKGDGPSDKDKEPNFAAKTPGMSRRNKAPPGLSIVAPSHQQFANERVIQSAPLGRSFTGQQHMPPSRIVHNNQASNLSHIHHVHANQTANRLPPISDVFGQNLSTHHENGPHTSALYPSHAASRPQLSPGLPPAHQAPMSGRMREYKSAEEAQNELAGGRAELLPRLVHYGGPQPPTPPSPVGAGSNRNPEAAQGAGRRRTRAEYEDGSSPPLGYGPPPTRRGPFGAGRDSPETQRAKKEEFMQLCARAWDLFHS